MLTDGQHVVTNTTVIDNRGQVLLVEYSSRSCVWEGLSFGQRAVYRAMVEAGRGRIVAALAKHREAEVIDGTDVVAFQIMEWDGETGAVRYGPARPGIEWVGFVEGMFEVKQVRHF